MNTALSDDDEARLKAEVRGAGLGRALALFHDDMRSAFHAATGFRRALGPDLEAADEPWSPRLIAGRSD
jgi:hypothetical protein